MLRYLYSFLFYLMVPYILVRLWWRSRRNRDYKKRVAERFAYLHIPKKWQHGLWIHAVSVGEVMAILPLVKAVLHKHPKLPIIMTTMTPTGAARVTAQLSEQVFHCYVPYDLPTVVARFLKRTQPKAMMLVETELWPNILHQCQKRHIPVLMANARLSERSYRGYARLGRVIQQMLSAITILATHAQADAERFINLGMDPAHVVVTGSIKFEIKIPSSVIEQSEVVRRALGVNRPIWIAASTHESEEEQVLDAHKLVLQKIPNALLVLVPRHPERFDSVFELIKKRGFKNVRRSNDAPCTDNVQVYLGDTMGDLILLFAAVDLAFVGGSLIERGGHNLLEPAALGLAGITGFSNFNFADISKMLIEAKAVVQVNNATELAHSVEDLLQDSQTRSEMGEQGRRVIEKNRGALAKHMALLEKMI
jgi:3-deoxy-D-manno-octulosonic-acid transferase